MTDRNPRAAAPLLDQQLGLLIQQLCAVTGTWPVTVEFGILTLVIRYIANEADPEIVAQILESEAAIVRLAGAKVPPAMAKHHHDLIDQLLNSHMLKASAPQGSV